MATNTIKVRHQLAVKTESEWSSSNPVLKKGEVAFSSDKGYIFKVGNGTSTWSALAYSNQGPKGDKGTTGTRGSIWNVGTACTGTSTTGTVFATGISSSLVGDLYLNTSTGYVYRCTTAGNASTAKWSYVGSIKGAKGADGADGKDGTNGTNGATGPQGPAGPGVRLYSNDVTIDVSNTSGSASPWTYTATGLSCQTGDQIIVGYLPQSTASADKNAAKAYGYLAKAECTTNGQLKLTFLQAKPATDFKIRVLSFRTVS